MGLLNKLSRFFSPRRAQAKPVNIEDDLPFDGGWVDVEIIRDTPEGPKVIQRIRSHNTVVNVGKKQLLRRMVGLQTNDFDQFRVGTSAAAVSSAQSNVLSPVTGTLNTADSKSISSGRTLQLVVSYPSGAGSKSATFKEVALLNQNTSPGGSAFMRATFTAAAKTTSDKLKITYTVRVT